MISKEVKDRVFKILEDAEHKYPGLVGRVMSLVEFYDNGDYPDYKFIDAVDASFQQEIFGGKSGWNDPYMDAIRAYANEVQGG